MTFNKSEISLKKLHVFKDKVTDSLSKKFLSKDFSNRDYYTNVYL